MEVDVAALLVSETSQATLEEVVEIKTVGETSDVVAAGVPPSVREHAEVLENHRHEMKCPACSRLRYQCDCRERCQPRLNSRVVTSQARIGDRIHSLLCLSRDLLTPFRFFGDNSAARPWSSLSRQDKVDLFRPRSWYD